MKRRRAHRRHPAGMAFVPPEEEAGYVGPATLRLGDDTLAVTVHLAGHLEPNDGSYHWYGRIDRDPAVVTRKEAGATAGDLVVGAGEPVTVRLAEIDAWGHVQVNGTGPPPYPLEPVEVDLPVVPA